MLTVGRSGLVAMTVLGCASSPSHPTPAATPAPAPTPTAPVVPSVDVIDQEGYALIVPHEWRRMSSLETGRTSLVLQGDGVGIPAVDETDEPVQAGLQVERTMATDPEELIPVWTKQLTTDPRFTLVAHAVERGTLADGTKTVRFTSELLRQNRKSLYVKLSARDAQGQTWIVTGFVVTGSGSTISTATSPLASLLRDHVASFCFQPCQPRLP